MSLSREWRTNMHRLIGALPSRRRIQIAFLVPLMLLAATAEFMSLGAVVPFLSALADPIRVLQLPIVFRFTTVFAISDPAQLRWWLTIIFATAEIGRAHV